MSCSFSIMRKTLALLGLAVFVFGQTSTAAPALEEDFTGYANNYAATNLTGWSSSGEDLSKVTNGVTYTAASYTMPTTPDGSVLELNTEGNTLSADINNITTNKAYLDTMVYMVPSEDNPSTNSLVDAKVAVFANAAGNLIVYHGSEGAANPTNRFTEISGLGQITNKWLRLTISMDFEDHDTYQPADFFKVQLDGGAAIESDFAFETPYPGGSYTTGVWFRCANDDVTAIQDKIVSLGIQGTGYLDDVIVEEGAFTPAAYYAINTVLGANGSMSPNDLAIQVAAGGDTNVIYTADSWYQISEFTINGATNNDAIGKVLYTNSFVDVQEEKNVVVSFSEQLASDGKTPMTWAGPLGYSADEPDGVNGLSLYQAYLGNFDIDSLFEIIEISIDGSEKPSVKWLSLGVANGEIDVESRADLVVGSWTSVTGVTTHVSGTNTWVGNDVVDTADFYRVTITE